MTEPETPSFAAGFAPATPEDWRKLVDAVLKGASFERLVSTTDDGLRIAPLAARRADARAVATRRGAMPWEVLARIDHPDPALANELALWELENGASGLALVFSGAIGDYRFGLSASAAALARALEGVYLAAGITLEIDLPPRAEAVVDTVLSMVAAAAAPGKGIRIGHDPLGAMALAGAGDAARRWSEAAAPFARRLAALARQAPGSRLAAADGRVIHNAGGSQAQELAFVLAVALAYLRALEAEGVALEAARRLIFFRLVADADQFLTLVKFRALRKLWARVEAACGLAPEPAFVGAETAWRMLARRDAHVNILRATIAAFAAALGGADAITVLPFTAACGLADRFARRIARNTQLILLEESHLDKVADAAAGSGAVEDLTDELCSAAWALLREIEAAGGAAAALESGLIQQKVAAIRAQRAAALARRQDALTGVSVYPNLKEPEVATILPRAVGEDDAARSTILPRAAGEDDAARSAVRPLAAGEDERAPLLPIRLAAPFEALRDSSDRWLAANGTRPQVFLANLGAPAEFAARAGFARDLFATGGIEAVTGESHDPPALAAAFKASGAVLACLCSADKVYETEAAAAAAALKAAGARHVYLAGRPGERAAAWREAGVQSFIYEGCDALATLRGAYDILGSDSR